jgi:hypothetical protein
MLPQSIVTKDAALPLLDIALWPPARVMLPELAPHLVGRTQQQRLAWNVGGVGSEGFEGGGDVLEQLCGDG